MLNYISSLSADGYDALDRYLDEGFQGCTDDQLEALAHMDIEQITLDSPSARCIGQYGTTAAVIIRLNAGDGSRHDLLFYPVAAGAMMIKTREVDTMNRQISLPGQKQTLVGRTLDEANMLLLRLQGMSRGDWTARVCFRDDRGQLYHLDEVRLSREALDQVNTDPDFLHAVAEGALSLPYNIPTYQPPAEE